MKFHTSNCWSNKLIMENDQLKLLLRRKHIKMWPLAEIKKSSSKMKKNKTIVENKEFTYAIRNHRPQLLLVGQQPRKQHTKLKRKFSTFLTTTKITQDRIKTKSGEKRLNSQLKCDLFDWMASERVTANNSNPLYLYQVVSGGQCRKLV